MRTKRNGMRVSIMWRWVSLLIFSLEFLIWIGMKSFGTSRRTLGLKIKFLLRPLFWQLWGKSKVLKKEDMY